MDNRYLEELNDEQRAAIEYCGGPSLVIAGAGSGKTRVLTYKIAYLLEHGYEPWSILALTFTNKAASEMKARIARQVGEEQSKYLWMGTFHSIFLRILRMEHELTGFSPNFTIYDSADSKSLLKSVVKDLQLDEKTYAPGNMLGRISNAKNRLISPEAYAATADYLRADTRARIPSFRDVYRRYAERCRLADAMDFDDILVYTYRLFDEHPEVLAKYVERFRYVLVDEYQDTNFAQHKIVWQLTRQNRRICVVGDDAQSIYSFRGANIDNILSFSDLYGGARLFKLERNYRSTQIIVEAANSLIAKNEAQIRKDVYSDNERGDLIGVFEAYSDVEEGGMVVRKIESIRKAEGCGYSDFAILYRTNAQSRIFEEALRKNGMPYRIYGGLSFYQRKEIKDIIAYFRLSVNPNDEEAFKRVINYPARGIGNTTMAKIADAANRAGVSLWTAIGDPLAYGIDVAKGTAAKIAGFRMLIEDFIELARTKDAKEAGEEMVKRSGIINDIYQDRTPDNLSRQENVEELMNGMADFCEGRKEEGNGNVSISDYLSEVSLLSDVDTDKGDDEHKVTLMTIHSAKGLEFGTVFVVGLEENLFPSQMASGSMREMEEERRLFYVAITRAEKHCFLSYARSRYRYGKMEFGTPSRFIGDIDPCYLDRQAKARTLGKDADVELPWASRERTSTPRSSFGAGSEPVEWRGERSERFFERSQKMHEEVDVNRRQEKLVPPSPAIRKLRPVPAGKAAQAGSAGVDDGLSAGQHIEHERFGRGTVEKVEGRGDNCKATVRFENAGVKQLLLKFARFKVVD